MAPATHARRWLAMLAAAAVAVALGALPAAADTAPVDPTDPATPVTFAADALPAPQIDGVVWTQVTVGTTVYVGGKFTTARPAGSAAGVNTVPRSNVLAYDLTTGALLPWAPVVDGQVTGITASPDGTKVYITGEFTRVNGEYHVRVAAFSAPSGALLSSFRPVLASKGLAVSASNSTLYVGGNFTSVASQTGGTLVPASHLAAFDATTGAVRSGFAGSADAPVLALAVTPSGNKVVVGGRFDNLSGSAARGLGAVDPTTGAQVPFPANQYVWASGPDAAVLSLTADESGIYGTAYHFGDGGNLEGPFRADPVTGELLWVADCHGDTYSAFPVGEAVYTASHQHYCGNMGGFPQTEPWTLHYATAFSVATTGVNTPDIYGYPDHPGEPAPSLLTWYPQFYSGSFTGQGQAGWSVTGNDDYISFGGEFPGVNGQPQQGLVRFARSALAPNKQGPRISGAAFNPRLNSFAAGQVRVSFTANWDRDNETLTYRVYRGSQAVAPVYTTTVTAKDWALPTLGFTDTAVSPGSTQRYRVTATDPFGNVAQSEWVTVTVATTGTLSAYGQTVLDDNPSSYWRFGEQPGATAAFDWSGLSDLTVGTGVTLGTSGAILGDTNTSASFDGTGNGLAATQTAEPGPQVFSVETWFRSTSTAGGKIVGFGNQRTGESSNYDRHFYLEPSGRVTFGVWVGEARTLTSSTAVNDGQWHHVVATLGPTGMAMYLDGRRVGTRTDTTNAQSYNGYWRVGGDSPWSGAAYFAGDVDDVAVYQGVLTWQQVIDHWTASGRTSPVPPVPADASGAAVRAADPDLYWRLDEPSGTTANDISPNDADGTYRGGVTLGAPGALVGGSGTAATFDGASGLLSSNGAYVNPTTYSEELWFSTTTTNGGKLIGFGRAQDGLSSSYDRHVYLENSGQLTFGVWTGQMNTITSPLAYNDGQWHHMVATQSSAGMRLYVDGVLVGTNPQTAAENYTGYWRVGSDNTWAAQPYFAGVIDEVAVYSTALSAQTVADHHALGTATAPPNQAPTAAFTSSTAGLTASVDGSGSSDPDGTVVSYSWQFGDGSTGSGATASHTYAAAGTYAVTLTVTDDDGATAAVSHDVEVVAPNQAPTAAFTVSAAGLTASVDGSGSSDPDGTVVSHAWQFGDGSTGSGATASHTYAAAGTYAVTLTVTDDDGATAAVSHDVTVTAPTGGQLASDAFGRTLASGWGTADLGGAWTVTGAASGYSVGSGVGVQRLTTAGATRAAHLSGVSSTDADVQVALAVDKAQTGGGTYVSVIGRRVGSAEYTARLRFLATGVVNVAAMSTGTALASANLPGTYTPGSQLRVRVQVTGTSPTAIRVKVWSAGAPEPGAWTVQATDSAAALQTAGGIGLSAYLSGSATNAPVTVTFDDLSATTSSVVPPPNQAPTAAFTATASGLTATLDGTGSGDVDGSVVSYAWSFGDGTTGSGASTSHAYAAGGTYTVTLTVTDDDGATAAVSHDVAVTAPPAGQIAADAFGRTLASGWGSADLGGAWTLTGAAAGYAVDSGAGVQRLTAAGGTRAAYLTGVASTSVEVQAVATVDKAATGGGTYVSVIGRRVGTTEYGARLRFLSTGVVNLAAMQTGTALASVNLPGTYTPGTPLQVRLQVAGTAPTTVRAEVWAVGTAEPATWQVSVTDSTAGLQVAGGVGLTSYLSGSATNAPVTVRFDDLTVTGPVTP